jgi:hypothetical protein
MGEIGAGKSSVCTYLSRCDRPKPDESSICQFINSVIGRDVALVNHGFSSYARSVKAFPFKGKDDLPVALIDTPGLGNYGEDCKTDTQILQMIAEFLNIQ